MIQNIGRANLHRDQRLTGNVFITSCNDDFLCSGEEFVCLFVCVCVLCMLKGWHGNRFLSRLDETVDSLKKESNGAPITLLAHSVSYSK